MNIRRVSAYQATLAIVPGSVAMWLTLGAYPAAGADPHLRHMLKPAQKAHKFQISCCVTNLITVVLYKLVTRITISTSINRDSQ